MRRRTLVVLSIILAVLGAGSSLLAQQPGPEKAGEARAQAVLGTGFTYQGQLTDGDSPADGEYDFEFMLYDDADAGVQVGDTVTVDDRSVTDGTFTVELDFGGGAFNGEPRYLEIGVRPGSSSGAYTTLSPRQALTPAPYALALPGLWTQQTMTSTNLIGGHSGNWVADGVWGATISGGSHITITGDYATVAGGEHNAATGDWATISGGDWNIANGTDATIGGGYGNEAGAPGATVAGGGANTASGGKTAIGGGTANTASADYSTVGGGHENTASAVNATVGGGKYNTAAWGSATVGGGEYNMAEGHNSTVGGGGGNLASGTSATVAGGVDNTASGEYNPTVSGGYGNTASGTDSTVGGGTHNTADGWAATVSGGYTNTVSAVAGAVGGGEANTAGADYATIDGGYWNVTWGYYSAIGGGYQNFSNWDYATIGGGRNNQVYANLGSIGGGGGEWSSEDDCVDPNDCTYGNIIEDGAEAGTIGGGTSNIVASSFGTIGGGTQNTASGLASTVAGGSGNVASGDFSYAAGYRAKAEQEGAFVWAAHGAPAGHDPTSFSSTGPEQFLIKARGGVGITTDWDATGLDPEAALHIAGPGPFVYFDMSDFHGDEVNEWVMGPGYDREGDDPEGDMVSVFEIVEWVDEPYRHSLRRFWIEPDGLVNVPTLKINGGSDLAEPFEVTEPERIEPGMVVAIDPEHPGQLRAADRAYDRLVAGCVSGANGVESGLVMQQEGLVDDEAVPVALSGRVYCWADAAYSPIEPGDLLTTSDTPGHVMAVRDYERAQGAILGKAMSALEEDRGFVLVLVSLQ